MGGPCGGGVISHLQYVGHHLVNCRLRVGPDGVEKRENIKMNFGLNRKLAKKKVKTGDR